MMIFCFIHYSCRLVNVVNLVSAQIAYVAVGERDTQPGV